MKEAHVKIKIIFRSENRNVHENQINKLLDEKNVFVLLTYMCR